MTDTTQALLNRAPPSDLFLERVYPGLSCNLKEAAT